MLSLHALVLLDCILTFIYALILSTLSHALTSQRNCLCNNLFFKYLLGIPCSHYSTEAKVLHSPDCQIQGTLFSLCLILSLSRIQCGWLLPALKKIHSWHTLSWLSLCLLFPFFFILPLFHFWWLLLLDHWIVSSWDSYLSVDFGDRDPVFKSQTTIY